MIKTPCTPCCTSGEMPSSTIPLPKTAMIRTPIRVLRTPPSPPVSAVPPTTTAVTVENSLPLPINALPRPSCAAASSPPSPYNVPAIMKTIILTRLTGMPDRAARSSPHPGLTLDYPGDAECTEGYPNGDRKKSQGSVERKTSDSRVEHAHGRAAENERGNSDADKPHAERDHERWYT